MRKSLVTIVAIVTMSGLFTEAMAWEFRAPLISERGPMRYLFSRDGNEDYRLNFWTTTHSREADSAFRSHGTNTKQFPTVIFGKEEFRLSEIFPGSKADLDTEFYNPYMNIIKIAPRATYHERGATFGGRVDFSVWKGYGRIGLRATVPFREIQIECDDKQGRGTAQIEDLVAKEYVLKSPDLIAREAANPPDRSTEVLGCAWRLDFLEALIQSHDDNSVVDWQDDNVNNSKVGAQFVGQKSKTDEANAADAIGVDVKVVVSYSPEGTIPRNRIGTREIDTNGSPSDHTLTALNGIAFLPTDLGTFTDDKFYVINNNDYTGLSDHNNPNVLPSVQERSKQQSRKAELWVSTVFTDDGSPVASANSIISGIEDAIKAYNENHFEWMHDRGFDFETDRAFGLGDIDLDLFYEHRLADDLIVEGFIGFRFPTGANDKYHRNPFEVHFGNGQHWEIKLGVLGAWEPLHWMNIKADLMWSFVIDDTERRTASFKGAQVKNIGPKIKADVDWGYLVFDLDLNFYHRKDSNLTGMIGYQLYYKTKDDVSFKKKTLETWLGKKFNTTTRLYNQAFDAELDSCVLEKRTEAVGHRLRLESSYRFSKWFEGFAGTMFTFAGQNLSRELDYHAGINVRFK